MSVCEACSHKLQRCALCTDRMRLQATCLSGCLLQCFQLFSMLWDVCLPINLASA